MYKIDFVTLMLLVIAGFFSGTLYQTFRERQKSNLNYRFALTLFISGTSIIILILLYIFVLMN
jgi:hypothetical protein